MRFFSAVMELSNAPFAFENWLIIERLPEMAFQERNSSLKKNPPLNIYNTRLAKWLHKHHFSVRVVIAVATAIAFSRIIAIITHEILQKAGVFPKLSEPMFDRNQLMIELAFHIVYTVAGGILAAYIAREKANRAVFIFGSKEAILWLVGIVLLWEMSPPWFNLTKSVIGIPLALFGGWIYERYKRRQVKMQG